jgi:exodeoxyribonuclease V beta subunit
MKQLVSEKLSAYGFEHVWHDTVCEMIRNVLEVPIEEVEKDFTLSRILNSSRINELEFYFPLKEISKEVLQNIFLKYGNRNLQKDFPPLIGNLTFSMVKGFMKGFIDLVFYYNGRFYLVDWKSNLLGSDPENYRQENLLPAMQYDFYILQYHIYVLALHHYLALRVPGYRYEQHFGGVYYIFLRGVNSDMGPGYGIYRDVPSLELIQEMSRKLLGE